MSDAKPPLAGAAGSALVSLPTHVQEEIQKLLRAAWRDGFDAEHDGGIEFFDGFAIAHDLLAEPRRVCCQCKTRLCDGEEDEMCRECWDASIAQANATRNARIAAGWTVGPGGGLFPPVVHRDWIGPWLVQPNAPAQPRREGGTE